MPSPAAIRRSFGREEDEDAFAGEAAFGGAGASTTGTEEEGLGADDGVWVGWMISTESGAGTTPSTRNRT
jgi:hypothetical protein